MDKKKQIQKRLEAKRILKGKTTIKDYETYDDPKIVLEIPMAKVKGLDAHEKRFEVEFKELYIQLQKMYETVDKALEKENVNNDKLIEVNNSLVRLQSMLLDKGLRIKNVESLEAATKAAVDNLKDIKVPENLTIKNMPNWLASEKSLEEVNKNLAEISSQMGGLETTPQGQKAEDYVPFRRVVAEGQRLRFDDFIPGSGGGGSGGVGLTDAELRATPVPISGTVTATAGVTGTLSNDTSVAYEASSVTKASAGTVYGVTGYNSRTTAQFFQFFNSATVPADTSVPVITFTVAASSNFSVDFGVYGRYFSTGIAWANSSTGATKTIGANDVFCDVNYK